MSAYYGNKTPKGRAIFPNLRKPDNFNGQDQGYTLRLALAPEDLKKMKKDIEEFRKEGEAKAKSEGKDFSQMKFFPPIHDEKDGSQTVKFKSKHKFIGRDGNVNIRVIPIFDAKGQLIDNDKEIQHGSTVIVNYSDSFWAQEKIGIYGITLRINSVQVIENPKALPKAENLTAADFGFSDETQHAMPEPAPQQMQPKPQQGPGFTYGGSENRKPW